MELGAIIVSVIILLAVISSWFETAARISRIERKVNSLLRHQGVDPTLIEPLSDQNKQVANDPTRKIEAIKMYRQETGAGLAEAKKAVEDYIQSK